MEEFGRDQLELKEALNSNSIAVKTDALKKIIALMTMGKSVTKIFQHVIKCLELPNLELKKIVYLYIINNSKNCPDDALMIINQFCKDARDKRPIIRALAIRTMGYLRVAKLNEYLIDPLMESLRDSNPYVRKTAVNCVPKVLEVSRELIESKDILNVLRDIIESDTNPSVIAAAFISEKEIHAILGRQISVTPKLLLRVLNLCDAFSDFEQIYVFEILAENAQMQADLSEAEVASLQESINNKILPKLNHCNKALVLTVLKLLVRFSDVLALSPNEKEKLLLKITKSLQPLLNQEEEVSLLIAQTFMVLNRKYPELKLLKDPTIFFCRNEDSMSLKVLKLKLIKKSTTASSSMAVFDELISYFKSTDLEFGKKAVRCVFRIAQRLPTKVTFSSFSQKIGQIGLNFIATKNYVLLEEIVAGFSNLLYTFTESISKAEILGLFKSERTLAQLIQQLSDSKVDFVSQKGTLGLLGLLNFLPIANEADGISLVLKKDSLFYRICDSFFRENEEVQLAIIGVLVRLYLLEIDESDALLTTIFERVAAECRSALVKDTAYSYWRLLISFPDEAKAMVFDSDLAKKVPSKTDDLLGEELPESEAVQTKPADQGDTRNIGTFLSFYYSHAKDQKIPNFLLSDNYRFRNKGKDKYAKMNLIEKKLLFEKEKAGKKGRNGIEIVGSVDEKKGNFLLSIDLKNVSALIHEIEDVTVAPNHAGFELDAHQVAQIRSRAIQRNEICMLELALIPKKDRRVPIDHPVNSLHLEFSFRTDKDVYDFKVPYPLSLLLNPTPEETEDQKVLALIAASKPSLDRFSLESYEENMNKFAKFFEVNRVHKSQTGEFHLLRVGETLIAAFKLDKKMDSDIEVALYVFDKNYGELAKGLICFLINLV